MENATRYPIIFFEEQHRVPNWSQTTPRYSTCFELSNMAAENAEMNPNNLDPEVAALINEIDALDGAGAPLSGGQKALLCGLCKLRFLL